MVVGGVGHCLRRLFVFGGGVEKASDHEAAFTNEMLTMLTQNKIQSYNTSS